MAGRRINWTLKARHERRDILFYWTNRNKSSLYSKRLRKLINQEIKYIAAHPNCGLATNFENTYYVIVRDYLIFYNENPLEVTILSIWDGRQDPGKLKQRLE